MNFVVYNSPNQNSSKKPELVFISDTKNKGYQIKNTCDIAFDDDKVFGYDKSNLFIPKSDAFGKQLINSPHYNVRIQDIQFCVLKRLD